MRLQLSVTTDHQPLPARFAPSPLCYVHILPALPYHQPCTLRGSPMRLPPGARGARALAPPPRCSAQPSGRSSAPMVGRAPLSYRCVLRPVHGGSRKRSDRLTGGLTLSHVHAVPGGRDTTQAGAVHCHKRADPSHGWDRTAGQGTGGTTAPPLNGGEWAGQRRGQTCQRTCTTVGGGWGQSRHNNRRHKVLTGHD